MNQNKLITIDSTAPCYYSNLMSKVAASNNLDTAFKHVFKNRKESGYNCDIWGIKTDWSTIKKQLQRQLLAGNFHLSPLEIFNIPGKPFLTRWTSIDAIVLKAISNIIADIIGENTSASCFHLKDKGGLRGAVTTVAELINSKNHQFVIKSDVASFYQSMNHDVVMEHVKMFITDKRIIAIIYQYLTRVEILDGNYIPISCGIPKGCPLSPLMGGIILKSLDEMSPAGTAYVRYMDDWVILTKSKSQLRKLVKKMHAVMKKLKFKLALDKTFIGKISKGFDFLGYRFSHEGIIDMATKTILNFTERLRELYEQGVNLKRLLQYVRRWQSWCIISVEHIVTIAIDIIQGFYNGEICFNENGYLGDSGDGVFI